MEDIDSMTSAPAAKTDDKNKLNSILPVRVKFLRFLQNQIEKKRNNREIERN